MSTLVRPPIIVSEHLPLDQVTLANGTTFKPGDLFGTDANGITSQLLAVNSNSAAGTRPTHIAHSERTIASSAGDNKARLVRIDQNTRLSMSLTNVDAPVAWAQTRKLNSFDVRRTAAGEYVIGSTTANPTFYVESSVPGTESDACGEVVVALLNSNLQP